MLGLALVVVSLLLWLGLLKRESKPPESPTFTERETEARIQITRERIADLEPRLGQPRKRGFECIEWVD
jgi:hypothetical protein